MLRASLVIGALVLALAAQADDFYYRSTMPDGKTVIGDKPAPGAKEVQKIPLRPGNVVPSAQPPAGGGQPMGDRQRALDTADADVQAARQELEAAQAALTAGQEPQAGDRTGTVSGRQRFNDAYLQRVKSLQDAVAAAQKKLDDAQARRNNARF